MKRLISKIVRRINQLIERTEWYNNYWGGVCKFWSFEKKYVNVINLGSNSAKNAFCYDRLNIKGLNMALGPQSLGHDMAILKNYFSYLEDGGTVFITLCPFSCLKANYTAQHNLKYYTILHPATIFNFDESQRVKALSIQYNPLMNIPMVCLKGIALSMIRKFAPKKNSVVNFEQSANSMIDMWKQQFMITDLSKPLSENHKTDFMNRVQIVQDMIKFCRERDLKPYVVLPPIHKSLSEKLGEDFMKHYVYDFIDAVGANDILLDYFKSTDFNDDSYFMNSFYLNKVGAEKFTKDITERVNVI